MHIPVLVHTHRRIKSGASSLVSQLQFAVIAEMILESFAELRRCAAQFADPSVLATEVYPAGSFEFLGVALSHTVSSYRRLVGRHWRRMDNPSATL